MTEEPGSTTIESRDMALADVFNDFYIVPSYQREFVWEQQEVEQLLQDIFDAFPETRHVPPSDYFVGSLVVCPAEAGVLELIDGQQRMTTAYLFLCAVRDCLKDLGAQPLKTIDDQVADTMVDHLGEESYRYRVCLQYEDSLGLLERIASGRDDLDGTEPKTRSVTNIISAYETIGSFLTKEFSSDEAEVRRFYGYFINRVKVVRIKTQNVAHALKVFETINDRGVGLDAMDLLKNLMFMRAQKKDFDKLRDKWKELVDTLFSAGEKPLRFLRYFIFSTYGVERLREDEIYSWFVKNEKTCGYAADPVGFVNTLHLAAEAYTRFVKGRNADGTPNRYLANIRYLSGAARQHLILLLAGRHLAVDEFTELCRQLENLFFVYIITREPTKEFERGFARWSTELRKVHDRPQLDTFISDHIVPAKEALSARFELAFQQLSESSIQKYRMRYILGKTTQYVNELAYGASEDDLGKFTSWRDVEHILPQTPTAEIIRAFDQPDEIDDYIHRLGNMCMLEHSINRSIRNLPFKDKKKKGYAKSQFLLTKTIGQEVQVGANTAIDRAVRGLLTFDEWSSESIERRQNMLATLAARVWDMPEP